MTIAQRIVGGFGIVLILLLAMTVVGITELAPLQSGYVERNQGTADRLDVASEIDYSSAAMGTSLAAALTNASPDARAESKTALESEIATVRESLDAASTLDKTAEGQTAIAQMKTTFNEFVQKVEAALALAESDNPASLASYNEQVVPAQQQMNGAIDEYATAQKANQSATFVDAGHRMNVLLITMGSIASVTFIIAAIIQTVLARRIRRELRQAVASIGSSASEMLAVATQVAAGTAETAVSTNETTATVEEVKQTALLATEKASQVAESSQEVARVAETGRQAVEDTIAGIERMQGQMEVVAETINRLSEQTQAVGEIISTVSDLAEQSNLLSVNASIEAAKAGDHGKGFTVVAQEVKSLATQSKQAVAQVRTILSEIQKAGTMAVQAAEQGKDAIESGRRQSLESGEAIHRLAESVTQSAQSAVQIAASSRQQLAGMEQISQALESINQAGSESAKGTRQVEHEVKQLQELALRVTRLVDRKATAYDVGVKA
jgi:methyl-accepting chemotaxis protein